MLKLWRNHPAFSRKCERFKEAKQVKAVQEQLHCSYANAVRNLKELRQNPIPVTEQNNLDVIRDRPSQPTNSVNFPSSQTKKTLTDYFEPVKPTKCTIATQTDEWPAQNLITNSNQNENQSLDAENLI